LDYRYQIINKWNRSILKNSAERILDYVFENMVEYSYNYGNDHSKFGLCI